MTQTLCRTLSTTCLSVLLCIRVAAQTPPPADLNAARAFVHSLPTGPAREQILLGPGRANGEALLTEVFNQGMSPGASLDDWADLHLALAALIDIYSAQGDPNNLYRASSFAGWQDTAFRNHENNYTLALAAARKSLDLAQRSGLTDTLFTSWDSVARDLMNLGRFGEAVAAFEKSRDIIPSSLTYSRNASHVWRGLVDAHLAMNDLKGASEELNRFLQAAVPAPPFFRAQAQLATVDLKIAQGNYGEVPEIVNAALQSVLDPDEKKTLGYEAVVELLNCVLAAVNQLPYADALALAGKMDRDVAGLPFQVSGFARQAVRTRRRLAGDLAAVLREDSETVEQARASGQVRSEIEGLRILASDYQAVNSVSNQIAVLENAERLERSLLPQGGVPQGYPETFSWASTLMNLSIAYTRVKPFGPVERDKANHRLDEAIAAIDKQPAAADRSRLASARAEIELERGSVLALANQHDEALKIVSAALQDEGRDKADIYLRMARLDRDLYPDRAASSYDLAIDELTANRQSLRLAAVRVEAARVAALHGQTDHALKLLDQASKSVATEGFADTEWKLAYITGMVQQSQGQLKQAAESYLAAAAKLEALRSGVDQDQRQAFADSEWSADLYGRLIAVQSSLGRPQDAWRTAERAKARAFLDSLQGRQFKEDAAPQFQRELADLQKQMIELRVRLAPENSAALRESDPSPDALRSQLRDLETQFALARDRAGLSRSRASQAVATQPPALADLQARLRTVDKAALIVEFAALPDGLTAFLIGPAYFEQVVWKTDMAALADDVHSLRELLSDRDSGRELGQVAARVAQSVWDPLTAKLPAGTQHILIAPASFLNYIPFQILPASNGKQLIDQFVISYLPSASTLALLGQPGAPGGSAFLGALGSIAVDGMPPLDATLGEVDAIKRLLPKAAVAKEKELTHDAVLAALQERDLVHLATHGVYEPAAPLFSALVMSPTKNQASRLSLYELTDIQVRAKLVVLSACDSGIGKLTQGDEIAGLTRTFLSAGARTVVSSLWTVDDASTALLMQGFYQQLGKGVSPAAALRSAALTVRKQYPNPMFWAPFVLTGLP